MSAQGAHYSLGCLAGALLQVAEQGLAITERGFPDLVDRSLVDQQGLLGRELVSCSCAGSNLGVVFEASAQLGEVKLVLQLEVGG